MYIADSYKYFDLISSLWFCELFVSLMLNEMALVHVSYAISKHGKPLSSFKLVLNDIGIPFTQLLDDDGCG